MEEYYHVVKDERYKHTNEPHYVLFDKNNYQVTTVYDKEVAEDICYILNIGRLHRTQDSK